MPRLSQVARGDAGGLVEAYYARLFGEADPAAMPTAPEGAIANWWTTYALAPPIFEQATRHFAMLGILTDDAPSSTLDPHLRELAIVRAGYLIGSRFVFSQHCKAARRHGVAEEKLRAIRDWSVSAAFGAAERAVLAYVDALVLQQGRVSDAGFAALRTALGDRDIVELSHHVVAYAGYATIARALRLAFDDVDDRVTEIDPP